MIRAARSGGGGAFAAADRLHRLVALSAAFASDTAFARQLKRKWATTTPPPAAGTAAGPAAAAAGQLPSTDRLLSFYMEQQRSER